MLKNRASCNRRNCSRLAHQLQTAGRTSSMYESRSNSCRRSCSRRTHQLRARVARLPIWTSRLSSCRRSCSRRALQQRAWAVLLPSSTSRSSSCRRSCPSRAHLHQMTSRSSSMQQAATCCMLQAAASCKPQHAASCNKLPRDERTTSTVPTVISRTTVGQQFNVDWAHAICAYEPEKTLSMIRGPITCRSTCRLDMQMPSIWKST